MNITHKRKTAYELSFPMVDDTTPATFKSGVSPVDTAYYQDGAGAWTSLAITDTASEISTTGVYEISLTASELDHDRVMIKFSVAGAADTAFLFNMRHSVDNAVLSGTADSGSTTTIVDAARTEADTDYWKGSWIRFTSGTISGQTRLITGFTPGTDTITFTPATTQAAATNEYEILPSNAVDVESLNGSAQTAADLQDFADVGYDPVTNKVEGVKTADTATGVTNAVTVGTINANVVTASALATDAVNEIVNGVWNQDATSNQTVGTFGKAIGDPGVDTDTIWDLLNTNLDATVSSRMPTTHITAAGGNVTTVTNVTTVNGLAAGTITAAAVATGAIDADALATDAVDEIVDGVWNEDIVAAHGTADTAGLVLSQLTHRALATGWATDITANSVLDYMADDGTAVYDRTTDSLQALADSGGGGLTQQQVRDAMKLAPTVGAPSAGSVDEHLDDILTDTTEIGVAGAGLTNINLPDQTMNITGDITGNLSGSVGSVTTAVTLPTIPVDWITASGLAASAVDEIVDQTWNEDATGHQSQGTFGQAIGDPGVDTSTIWDLVNSNLDTNVGSRMPTTHIAATAGVVDNVDTVATTTTNTDMRGTDNAALATVCTEARLSELDAANIPADIDAILSDTGDMQPKFGTVTDLGGGATFSANLSDMAGATFATSTDSLEAIRNQGDAAWTTGAGGAPPDLLVSTTINTLTSQLQWTLNSGSADDGAYDGAMVVVTDSVTAEQQAVGTVASYTGATKEILLTADPGVFTMAPGDAVDVVAKIASGGGGGGGDATLANQTAIQGAGFLTATHSLVSIYNELTNLTSTLDNQTITSIEVKLDTGLNVLMTLQRDSDRWWWNDTLGVFESNPTFADRSIAMTEGTNEYLGYYTGIMSTPIDLSVDGSLSITFHDDDEVGDPLIATAHIDSDVALTSIDEDALAAAISGQLSVNPVIATISPVGAGGFLTIIIGNDYVESEGTDLRFTLPSSEDAQGDDLRLEIRESRTGRVVLSNVPGTLEIAGGVQTVSVDLPSGLTSILEVSNLAYRIDATSGAGFVRSILEGTGTARLPH